MSQRGHVVIVCVCVCLCAGLGVSPCIVAIVQMFDILNLSPEKC